MAVLVQELLAFIETPGTSGNTEIKLMDIDASPTALVTDTPTSVSGATPALRWIDGALVIVIDSA